MLHPSEYMYAKERMTTVRIECFGQVNEMKQNISEKVSEKMAIPGELIADVPIMNVRGKRSVCIENHKGVQVYEQEHIQIAVKHGSIHIYGFALTIARMTRKIVEIRGNLQRLELE